MSTFAAMLLFVFAAFAATRRVGAAVLNNNANTNNTCHHRWAGV